MKEIKLTKKETNYLIWAVQLLIRDLFRRKDRLSGAGSNRYFMKQINEVKALQKKLL